MSIYVVRNQWNGLFLHKAGLHGCVSKLKDAAVFRTKQDGQKEVDRYPSWRELVEVWWRVCWYERGERKPINSKKERATFNSSGKARASVYFRLLYGSGGSDDESGYKVVRVTRRVKA